MSAINYTPLFLPIQIAIDSAGDLVAGAVALFYLSGTTTPTPVYDSTGASLGTSVTADASGRFVPIYLDPTITYKIDLQTAGGVSLSGYPVDPFSPIPMAAANLNVIGTAGENISAGQAVYLSDGSGGGTAGRWYRASGTNDYSSSKPWVGIAPNAITSGNTGIITLSGRVTGLSGLVAGTRYYISDTVGQLTATLPHNARLMGEAESTTVLILTGNPPPPTAIFANVCGRLTLTSGTPVTTSDVTAATTLYFAPYRGSSIKLYSNSWADYALSQISIAVPNTASTMYDAFVYSNSGTPTLELLAWTNDTTRATALTTQDGILVKSGDATRLYVGSFRTTAVSGQTEDSLVKRYVWNYYNRVVRAMARLESTATWTYTLSAYQIANAAAANELDFVIGWAEVVAESHVYATASNSGSASINVAIGLDSTTTPTTNAIYPGYAATPATAIFVSASARVIPAVGRHVLTWLERSQAAGTTTWQGVTSGTGTNAQSGITGSIQG